MRAGRRRPAGARFLNRQRTGAEGIEEPDGVVLLEPVVAGPPLAEGEVTPPVPVVAVPGAPVP